MDRTNGAGRSVVLALAFAAVASAEAHADRILVETNLYARPSVRSAALVRLAPGTDVFLEDLGRNGWSRIAVGEFEGYVQTGALSPWNPWCDQGYPYSGSARYFEGLTELRTSTPLGFFFGDHVRRPC
jgi:hypothetical protein